MTTSTRRRAWSPTRLGAPDGGHVSGAQRAFSFWRSRCRSWPWSVRRRRQTSNRRRRSVPQGDLLPDQAPCTWRPAGDPVRHLVPASRRRRGGRRRLRRRRHRLLPLQHECLCERAAATRPRRTGRSLRGRSAVDHLGRAVVHLLRGHPRQHDGAHDHAAAGRERRTTVQLRDRRLGDSSRQPRLRRRPPAECARGERRLGEWSRTGRSGGRDRHAHRRFVVRRRLVRQRVRPRRGELADARVHRCGLTHGDLPARPDGRQRRPPRQRRIGYRVRPRELECGPSQAAAPGVHAARRPLE